MSPVPWKEHQKIAALLMSVDSELAAGILSQYDEMEIAKIGGAMSTLDPASLDEVNIGDLHKEFVDAFLADQGPENAAPSLAAVLDDLLSRALSPDKVRKVRASIEDSMKKSRPFLKIEKLKLEQIKRVLADEHPQVVALVCSKMSTDSTAMILNGMPDPERNDVVKRMASLGKPRAEYIESVARALEAKADSLSAKPGKEEAVVQEEAEDEETLNAKKLKAVAEVLKTVDENVEKSIIADLEEKIPDLVNQIREMMFTFEDLATLDKKSMQKILMGIDIRILATALKAADPAVEANFIANMAKRVQAMLAEERELLEEVTVEEITAAQKEILTSVRDLIDRGEIQIPRRKPNVS